MNHCPHCGKALESPVSFCPHCGKALSKRKPPVKLQLLFWALALLGVLTGTLLYPKLAGKPFSENTDAIAEASASVVTIYTYDVNNVPIAEGSGFAAIEEGIIVTNYHVIEGETYRIEAVTESGKLLTADTILCHDADMDIAVLKFYDCTLPCLPTADGMDLERGEPVTAIGSPIGFNNMVSTGVLSQYLEFTDTGVFHLLFTASISHGSSGGALFDNSGSVIGITSGGYEGGNEVYYAIPFTYVQELYDSRDYADEITPAKLWAKSKHSYTADYALAYPHQLSGKTIELKGYVSAVYHDLYLTADPADILNTTPTSDMTREERTILTDLIYEQRKANLCIMCQRESRNSFPEDLAGKYVTLRGSLTVYEENTSGDDVRFIVTEVLASE